VTLRQKLAPFAENIAESGAACLVTMVQGNLLLLGLSHWITASQTGLLAGGAAAAAITLTNIQNRLIMSILLGVITGFVDYFVHEGMFGEGATEAIVTGAGAAVLSYLVGTMLARLRRRRAPSASDASS
jgi:hypothetical protein